MNGIAAAEILMKPAHAGIQYRNNDFFVSGFQVPGFRRVDIRSTGLLQVPLIAKIRIISKTVNRMNTDGLGINDTGQFFKRFHDV